jgi:hypothetical protein
MEERTAANASTRANPLALPLMAVSLVAAAEGVALVVVLTRRPPPVAARPVERLPPAGETPAVAPAPTPKPAPTPAPPSARGKAGQRVESAGFGITVEKILHEPATFKEMARIGPDERYLALLVAADNNSGGNAQLFPSQFRLQDAQGYGYDPLNLKLTMPALEWRTLGNRETVRGHVDFVVPKSAKGLTLVYTGLPRDDAPPIHVELGE